MCSVSQVFSHSSNASDGHSREIKFHLVEVTPAPVLAGLDRFNDGVLGRMEMFGGVLVF
jgi:hypothetical protein